MSPFQLMTHDLARVLADLPADTPNRIAIFARALEVYAAFSISESRLHAINATRHDFKRVDEIQEESKYY